MNNFQARQSATRKTPDPSTLPFPGVISGTWQRSGTVYTWTPDRRFSVKGFPACVLSDPEGGVLEELTSFDTDGVVCLLEFNGVENDDARIVFAEKDPAIRGAAGEYVSTAGLLMYVPSEPTPQLLTAVFIVGDGELELTWDRNVTQSHLENINYFDSLGLLWLQTGYVSGDGTPVIRVTMTFDGDSGYNPDQSTVAANSVVSTVGAIANLGYTEFPTTLG